MFVARISGRSMEPKVPNGSWCLFRTDVTGSRDGRHLVVSHQDIVDPDFPMRVTLKRYRSEKIVDPDTGEWRHSRIVLEPLNSEYDPIELTAEAGDDGEGGLRVVAELVAVINES
jgi:SOS-response transcriptional repressor LexA